MIREQDEHAEQETLNNIIEDKINRKIIKSTKSTQNKRNQKKKSTVYKVQLPECGEKTEKTSFSYPIDAP